MAHKQNQATQVSLQQMQNRLLASYKSRENWMKWTVIIAIIVIILLLLLLGFATDWTRGLHKDSTTGTPVSSNLDALRTADGSGTTASTTGGGTTTKGTDTSSTTNGTDHTSSTTTNNTTTTTTNNSTTPGTQPSPNLLSLYTNTSTGDDLQKILDTAGGLGLNVQCHTDVLIKSCDIVDSNGNGTVTVKSILGTGIVTSVTNNF